MPSPAVSKNVTHAQATWAYTFRYVTGDAPELPRADQTLWSATREVG